MKKWFRNISNYWRFVNNRRIDISQPVFPLKLTLVCIASLITLPLVALLLLDPIYVEDYLSMERNPHPVWLLITDMGKSDWVLYPTGIVMIGLSVISADRFRKSRKIVWHRMYLNVHYLFTAVAFSGLIVLILKAVFSRARPEFLTGQGVWESKYLMFAYEFSSFPSGHSTTAGALAMSLSLMFPRIAWFFMPVGFLIALSRNAVYAHFPSDSVAGFLFGLFFTYFYARYFARKRLLFHFTGTGSVSLRGEGRNHMGLLSSLKSRKNK